MSVSLERLSQALATLGPSTARAIAAQIRQSTGIDVRKRDINPLLYGNPHRFTRTGDNPPVWHLTILATADAPPPRPPAREAVAPPGPVTSSPPPAPARVSIPVQLPPAPSRQVVREHRAAADVASHGRMTPPVVRTDDVPAVARTVSTPAVQWPLGSMRPHAWQLRAYEHWKARNERGIVEAVTGTGKTVVGLAAIASACNSGHRVLVLVPTIVLLRQWMDRVREHLPGLGVGLLGDGVDDSGRPDLQVLIAVINSAASRAKQFDGRFHLIVADECHRYGAPTFRQALLPSARLRLGLTATLERNDDGVDTVLEPYFGTPSFVYSYDEATSDGVLASFVVAQIGVKLAADERQRFEAADHTFRKALATLINRYGYPERDFGAVMAQATQAAKTMMTFYGEGKQAKLMLNSFAERTRILAETPGRTEALVALVPAMIQSGRVLVFTETVEAADRAAARLRQCGLHAHAYHSGVGVAQREGALQALGTGQVQVLVAVNALDEGVDVPDVDLGVVMSSSRSKRQMIQRLGRVIRKKPDGRYARLAILFAEDTHEDPRNGGHEAFLDQVTQAADEIERFEASRAAAASEFLMSFAGPRHAEASTQPILLRDPRDRRHGASVGLDKQTGVAPASVPRAPDAAPASVRAPVDTPRPSTSESVRRPVGSEGGRPAGALVDIDAAAGLIRIGSREFDLDADLRLRQFGAVREYCYRGVTVGTVSHDSQTHRAEFFLGNPRNRLTLHNPSREALQAALSLAIVMHQDTLRRRDGAE